MIDGLYISPKSAAPMASLQEATLIAGVGIVGDRYMLQTGTYSAKFMGEPGKNLTMVSADGVEAQMSKTGLKPLKSLGELRRNFVVRGLSAEALNDMVGHEVMVGTAGARLFVHRRTVPCKYREAQTKRPSLMNKLWEVCGVNCEILTGGLVRVGDSVTLIPNTYQPKRANPGQKPPGFFVKPSERTSEQHKSMVIPPLIAAIMCLVDPLGFQRVEDGYNSAGQRFWSPKAYQAGMLAKKLRAPLVCLLFVTVVVGMASVASVARRTYTHIL